MSHGAATTAVILLKKREKGTKVVGERKERWKERKRNYHERRERGKGLKEGRKMMRKPSSFRKEHYFSLLECIKVRLF